MRTAVLVEITGGDSHGDMVEERSDNLMDCRASWNVSFQLDGHEKPYCVSITTVNRVTPDRKILTSGMIKTIQNTRRRRGRKKWWSSLMDAVSQSERKEVTPGCAVWRFGGRAHCWPYTDDCVKVFGEYDAKEQHGYAVVIAYPHDLWWLKDEFPRSIREFSVTEDNETMFHSKW